MCYKELILRQRESYYKRHNLKKFIDWASPNELGYAEEGNAFLLRVEMGEGIQDFVLIYRPDDGLTFDKVDNLLTKKCWSKKYDDYRILNLIVIDIDTYVSEKAYFIVTGFNPYIEFYQAYQYWVWSYEDIKAALV